VKDQKVRQKRPIFSRKQRHQCLLDFYWIRFTSEPETDRQTTHVRVDDDTLVDSECISKNDVSCLATDAWKVNQLPHCRRNLATVTLGHRG